MRIAIDARELAGRATGVGRYLRELLQVWASMPGAAAHEFILCAPEPLANLESIAGGGVRTVIEPGRGTVWEQTMLPRLVRDAGAEVLFAPGYTAPLLSPAPVVLVVHDVSFCAHPEWFSWREGLRRRVLTRLSARRAARVLTVSDFSKREIVRHLGVPHTRVDVIYHGATRLTAPAPAGSRPAAPPMVLYVGSLFERRHIPQLVAGFARFAHQQRGATLQIVGDNRMQPPIDVAAVAAAEGAAGRVRLRSYVTDDELAALYANASAFAFLSDYEGFGMTPLEALASGVPPVVLDTEVAREIYGPAAVYVADANPALIAAALAAAVEDGPDRRQLLAAAPQVLARYSWEECAHRTLQAILASA